MKKLHYKSVLSWLLKDFNLNTSLCRYITLQQFTYLICELEVVTRYPKYKVELRTENFLLELATIQHNSVQLKASQLGTYPNVITSVRHFSTDFKFEDRKFFLRSIGVNI